MEPRPALDRQAPQNGEPTTSEQKLCRFVADLRFEAIPPRVIQFGKGLMIDWLGSALAGKGAPQVEALERFAAAMGPSDGPSTIVTSRRKTSPYFAAMVNAAASHVVEQDDVHNGSVFHPATVVFPPVLAVAEAEGKSGRDILTAAIAGYETGIRIGEFLGRSHYEVFHTTGTAGTLAAAMAVGKLLGLDAVALNHALGSAGTQAAGLWEFLRDAADSKQLHTAKAAGDGLLAAYLSRDGFKGATRILEGKQGLAAGMSSDADPSRLTDGLGTRWATEETSFKWHAACRHTHPAADALQLLMQRENLRAEDIAEVTCHVHQAAIDVLGPVTDPKTVHQAKFSMGTVLGLIAVHGVADLDAFERYALTDPKVAAFRNKVRMLRDAEVDALYPKRWVGKLTATSTLRRALEARVDEPKGDPGNTLSAAEIEEKATRLAVFRSGATADEMRKLIARIWDAESEGRPELLPARIDNQQ
ncbi:MmgE/PrpD family protein [Dongia sp.]|uniref:MmgE/PrpD family protein n=1 Tax=Dongia sp. TaxID=1977262 RepID=UPI003750DCF2